MIMMIGAIATKQKMVNDTDMLDGQGVIDYYKYDNCDYRFQTESGIWYSILDQDIGYEMVGEHSVI